MPLFHTCPLIFVDDQSVSTKQHLTWFSNYRTQRNRNDTSEKWKINSQEIEMKLIELDQINHFQGKGNHNPVRNKTKFFESGLHFFVFTGQCYFKNHDWMEIIFSFWIQRSSMIPRYTMIQREFELEVWTLIIQKSMVIYLHLRCSCFQSGHLRPLPVTNVRWHVKNWIYGLRQSKKRCKV